MIYDRNGVTFVELKSISGFAGDLTLKLDGKNIVLWDGISEEASKQIIDLWEQRKIIMEPASELIYLLDGGYLDLPVARSDKKYKKAHWLPVVFNAQTQALQKTEAIQ
jgi:hypothetical protein